MKLKLFVQSQRFPFLKFLILNYRGQHEKCSCRDCGVNDLLNRERFNLPPSHQGLAQLTCLTSSTQKKKIQSYNHQLITPLIRSAEAINSYNRTLSIISLQLQPLAVLHSPRAMLGGGEPPPRVLLTGCSARGATAVPWEGMPPERAHPGTATQPPSGSQGCSPGPPRFRRRSLPHQQLSWSQQGKAGTFPKGINISAPTRPDKQKPNDTAALPHMLPPRLAWNKGCGNAQCRRPALALLDTCSAPTAREARAAGTALNGSSSFSFPTEEAFLSAYARIAPSAQEFSTWATLW